MAMDEREFKKIAKTVRAMVKEARDNVELAGIYLDDGAPRSAADHLERAVTLLREAADARERAFGIIP